MKLKVMPGRLFIRPILKEGGPNGLVLTRNPEVIPYTGIVMYAYKGSPFKVGSRLVIDKNARYETVTIKDEKYLVINDYDVIGTIGE